MRAPRITTRRGLRALRLIARDAVGRRAPLEDPRVHLDEAARWLLRAQAATPDDGVSGGYALAEGWLASYPETTGYIIPTLLAYGEMTGREEYRSRALAMAEWELRVQYPDGGFPGHFVDRMHPPVVFNTGQVIFGLLAAHGVTGDARFLDAARRAAKWLVGVQDADGAWRRFDYRDTLHVYNTRVAWALVELGLAIGDTSVLAAGRRHLDWAVEQQEPDGWLRHCAFGQGENPFLHTIAYATQGLLEAGRRLGETRYVTAAERACRAVLAHAARDGFIAGTFAPGWRPAARYSCLTGNAQIAAQWIRLWCLTGETGFRTGATQALSYLRSLQDCRTTDLDVRGAIKGSHPLWGRYAFAMYPNWATKFFMDALLLDEAAAAGKHECIACW